MVRSLKWFSALALLGGLLWAAGGCVRNPVTGEREFHAISEKAELNLGLETQKAIVKEYGQYLNPAVQSYINEIGQKIVAVCDRPGVPYQFIVLDTPLVNAFAVPGCVFMTRGILELMDDEAELAGVIGHEVGHITGFHAVKLIQKSYGYGFLATFAAIAGTIYSPTLRDGKEYAAYYETLYRGIGIVSAGFLTGYGREFELEADRSGLKYAIMAGYDPDAMISFFKRMRSLEEEEALGIAVFLRTHPPTNDRIKQIKRILAVDEDAKKMKRKEREPARKIAALLKSTTVQFQDNFQRYQDVVKSIPKIEADPSGAIKDGKYENSRLGVKIEVPRGWKLERAYGKSLVSFFSADGKAQGELQYTRVQSDPVVSAEDRPAFAGTHDSTAAVTAEQWGLAVERNLRFQKRTGREVTYPVGPSYVGTYVGPDRLGRPAFYKLLFTLRGTEKGGQYDGLLLSCAAPEATYLDYLVDFEVIMKSLVWPKK